MEKKKIQSQDELENREWKLTDDNGDIFGDLRLISIVSQPAIEESFHLFSKEKKYEFAAINKEQQMLIGPAMVVNKKIIRYDKKNDEYFNCWFSEETVKKCSELFLKNSNHTKTNLEHGELLKDNQVNGAYVSQSWIVNDPEMDTACSYGFKPQKGDWYVAFKIENPALWNYIKDNNFTGFSIEGVFYEKFFNVFSDENHVKEKVKSILYAENLSDLEKEEQIKTFLKKL